MPNPTYTIEEDRGPYVVVRETYALEEPDCPAIVIDLQTMERVMGARTAARFLQMTRREAVELGLINDRPAQD